MTRETLPTVESPPPGESDHSSVVHGVVLAAGSSNRFGESNKLLESLDGSPLIRRAVSTLVDTKLSNVSVVVGYDHERIREALDGLEVEVRYNENHREGQSSSVRLGIGAARDSGADGVLFALGDMPAVDSTTINTLVTAYEHGLGGVLAAGYDGRRGNPVLFDSTYYDALESVSGDVGGRDVLYNTTDVVVVDTGDPGVLLDVDEPDDLRGLETGSNERP